MISPYGIVLSFQKKYNSATRTDLRGCPWYIARKVLTMYKASFRIVKINNVTMGPTACVQSHGERLIRLYGGLPSG